MGPKSQKPKSRTKTGCLRSYASRDPGRQQAKKCNAQKPQCSSCAKADVPCIWPDVQVLESRDHRRRDAQFPCAVTQNPPGGLDGAFAARDQPEANILHQAIGVFLPLLDLPTAHSEYGKVRNYIVGIACHNIGVMTALLTCGALFMSTEDALYSARALPYYSQSIVHLQENLKLVQLGSALDEATLDLPTVNVILLCLAGSWGKEVSADHRCHILEACRIFQFRMKHLSKSICRSRNSLLFQRILCESIIHQVCLTQMTMPTLDGSDLNLIEETLWPSIQLELGSRIFSNDSWSTLESPILGLPWQLHKLAFDVNNPKNGSDPDLITLLLHNCEVWKQGLGNMALGSQTVLRGKLHLLALAVLLSSRLSVILETKTPPHTVRRVSLHFQQLNQRLLREARSLLGSSHEMLLMDDTFHGILGLDILKRAIHDSFESSLIEYLLQTK
ncbi:Zn(II)2Cys6 transcription factor domain-containing protein [Aspergillus brunneoviolaceus CBS 621.78]|uniref:Uncharacterized protein n=1 Tax=Aspergillus brunneoviolaceus CBS 621.78 TaxID=1450534 RepID=A0ACD1FVG6_9EURO|nr:hypothetical protein BO95DRAFT_485757 [Aspergillus brunneoviolaceus CBS 621.78]RAH41008.1 hypothetical protein BO95DRAFT_485757 [Aspergillus brunneoviolaceus CBS 621.78]